MVENRDTYGARGAIGATVLGRVAGTVRGPRGAVSRLGLVVQDSFVTDVRSRPSLKINSLSILRRRLVLIPFLENSE